MDSITHIALGAVVGEAIAGKKLGKRAMFIGALAQSIPDIDFIAAFWLAPADNLLAHRGFTHSFLFGILATALFAFIAQRLHYTHRLSYGGWAMFIGIEILLHLLLDVCNAYGVSWFAPFSHQRYSFHVLFVADPFYSMPLGIAVIILLWLNSKSHARRFWIAFGLIVSTAYFLHAITNKIMVNRETKLSLEQQKISYKRMFTTPTPLNSWLWYVVVEDSTGFYTAHRSVADDANAPLAFTYFPQQPGLIEPLDTTNDIQKLKRFSQGFFTIEQWGDTLVFNDLRFGQIAGWDNPEAKFVFQYFINYPDANRTVMQRGRFSNWNRKTFKSMVNRILGRPSYSACLVERKNRNRKIM